MTHAPDNLLHVLNGKSLEEATKYLSELRAADLINGMLNTFVNDWCSDHADGKERWADGPMKALLSNHGKALPYIGWYWRPVYWFGGPYGITVADCGDFIGHCENNKWGYDQRYLTDDERVELVRLMWDLMILVDNADRGPDDETKAANAANAAAQFEKVWEWHQCLFIPPAQWR